MALAVLLPTFGNHGLWAAMMVMFLACTATLAVHYPALEAAAAPRAA
jgi:MATE family multidrug resistance protein